MQPHCKTRTKTVEYSVYIQSTSIQFTFLLCGQLYSICVITFFFGYTQASPQQVKIYATWPCKRSTHELNHKSSSDTWRANQRREERKEVCDTSVLLSSTWKEKSHRSRIGLTSLYAKQPCTSQLMEYNTSVLLTAGATV